MFSVPAVAIGTSPVTCVVTGKIEVSAEAVVVTAVFAATRIKFVET